MGEDKKELGGFNLIVILVVFGGSSVEFEFLV